MNLGEGIDYIDFHTHKGCGSVNCVALVNLMAGESVPGNFAANTLFSAGIHPWYAGDRNASALKSELIISLAHPHVVAVGEAGFDALRGPSMEVQEDIFIFQAELAEELQKPLIIHCVKSWDKLIKSKRTIKPSVPWVVHGFRGKNALALLLHDEDFCFSLGIKGITDDIVSATGTERLFLETDDTGDSINNVYLHFSAVTGINEKTAQKIFRENFNRLMSF